MLQDTLPYVDIIEQAVVVGDPVLIENLEETIDPILDPLLGRHTLKKGRSQKNLEKSFEKLSLIMNGLESLLCLVLVGVN
ncbi:hypothetical protein NDU88_004930 [Pleurodeles waltl]|uniref:Dynein heavy chain ATP-binding dynein motor region domain-containing protein n=1 Tax=Pleurodeles waltl TaxID=8319 RepID=A0AAV7UHR6_PLEWA|nr:hypothetical protein NDU88_004930 [Pleurodeles waltl]